MIRSALLSSGLKRVAAAGTLLGLVAIGTAAAPAPAQAWWAHGGGGGWWAHGGGWCCGVGIGVVVPPVVVAPAPVYVPPPVYYAPAPAYYAPPQQVWVPAHWQGGYWIPGHWA